MPGLAALVSVQRYVDHGDLEYFDFFGILHPFWLLDSFFFLFLKVFLYLSGGFEGDIPFRSECFEVSYSLHNVSICSHLLQEQPSLMIAERNLPVSLAECHWESLYHYNSFFRPIVLGFALGCWNRWSLILGHQSCITYGLEHMNWAFS